MAALIEISVPVAILPLEHRQPAWGEGGEGGHRGPVSVMAHVEAPSVASGEQGQGGDRVGPTSRTSWTQRERLELIKVFLKKDYRYKKM